MNMSHSTGNDKTRLPDDLSGGHVYALKPGDALKVARDTEVETQK
jgi:hypothetical protein